MQEKKIERGTLVVSLVGHDKSKVFVITEAEGDFVYIADGKTRSLFKPKRKKAKHLKPLNVKMDLDKYESVGGLTDGALIKEIKANLKENGG